MFSKRNREIERLNKEVERLQIAHAERCKEIDALIDNPYSEKSLMLKLTRDIHIEIIRTMWNALGCKPNYDGINFMVPMDPTVAIVSVEP